MLIRSLLIIIATSFSAAFAADPLTRSEVENLKTAVEKLEAFYEANPELESVFDFDPSNMAQETSRIVSMMFDDGGNVVMFSNGLQQALEGTDKDGEIKKIVTSSGFRSMDQFASVGDRVAAAAMAAEMSQSDLTELRMVANIPEEQLSMIPAEMRGLVQLGPKIADAVDRVPASDLALVKELRPLD